MHFLKLGIYRARSGVENVPNEGLQMAASSSSSTPCAACKFLRRKCVSECIFAPFFPPDQPHKFANVHKVYGASNVTKILSDLPRENRQDAANSLAYEAYLRLRNPVYGCVGAILSTQEKITALRTENEILLQKIKNLMEKGVKMPNIEILGQSSESVGFVRVEDQHKFGGDSESNI